MKTEDIYMLIAGGMAVSMIAALARRDGPSAIAMSFAGIVAGSLGGLPRDILSSMTAVLVVALAVSPIAVILARIQQSRGFTMGVMGTLGVLALSHHPASAGIGVPPWDDLARMGDRLQAEVKVLSR